MTPSLLLVSVLGTHQMTGLYEDAPAITAKSAIVMDANSGRVLYGKNIHTSRYPASTTKILTALLLLENTRDEEMLTAPENTEDVTGSSLHLKPGEYVSAREMLYALLLRSANDGAYTTALKIAGSEEKFAELMNRRASEIGCRNTRFFTSHGLNHDYHLSTAYDLALIAKEAVKNEKIVEVASTARHSITRSLNDKDLLLINNNKLLAKRPEFKGLKTGWTVPAGRCFVGYAEFDSGMPSSFGKERYISVVLGSQDWQADTTALVDWAASKFELSTVRFVESRDWSVPVIGGREPIALLRIQSAPFLMSLADYQTAKVVSPASLMAPVKAGKVIQGTAIELANGELIPVQASSMSEVKASWSLRTFIQSPGGLLSVIGLGGMAYWSRLRNRRNARRRIRR
ncbi:D-alanyl-D-alanine carboxypeptidase family protein [Kamptonema cortianum]|nr:D-alanyl-D-alanine carboxypeptidase family protein [Geitlerinema splendidum]MDK3160438.1 D-alanyl-D-alanine carboxypeptidase family protein [Kamptonema cortianum]